MRRKLAGVLPLLFMLSWGCARRSAAVPVATPPGSQQTIARQVREAKLAGEGDPAVRILRQRLAANPDSLDLRLELAGHYEKSGVPDLALEHVRLARRLAPSRYELAAEEARLLLKQELPEEAAKTLEPLMGNPGIPPTVPAWLGIALDESGDLAAGEQAHRAALALAPEDDAVLNNLGFNLLRQNRPEEAIRVLEAALRVNRENSLARSNLARAMSARAAESDSSGAVAHWSVALDPASAHNNLAASLIERGDYAHARKELEAALAIERNHLAAWNNLRLVAELDGKPVSAPANVNPGLWRRFTAFWKKAFRATQPGELKEGPAQRASK